MSGGVRWAELGLRFMARKLRIQYPGAIYHVMNRGDHQELTFADDDDRSLFVSTLAEVCQRAGWQIHSFCLMSIRKNSLPRGARATPSKSTSPPSSGQRPRSWSVGLRSGWRWEHAGIWRTCFIARGKLRLRLHRPANRLSIYDIIID